MLKRVGVLILCFIFVFLTACSDNNKVDQNTVTTEPKLDTKILSKFKLVSAEKRNIVLNVNADGYIQSNQLVNLKSQMDGRIIALPYNEGDFVKQNALLVELDQTKLLQDINDSRTNLILAGLDLDMAKRKYNETEVLFNLKSASKDDYLQGQISLKKQNYSYKKSQMDLANKEKLLNYAKVYAPFDGKITKIATSLEANVSAGNDLLSIANMSKLSVVITLLQDYIPYLKAGIPILLSGSSIPDGQVKADFVSIQQNTNAGSGGGGGYGSNQNQGQISIICSFQSKYPEKIYLGTYVSAQLTLAEKQDAWVLPIDTLWIANDNYYVAVLDKTKNQIKKVSVKVGINDGNYVEILNADANLLKNVILINSYQQFLDIYPFLNN